MLNRNYVLLIFAAQHNIIATVLAGELPYLMLLSAASLSSCSLLNAYYTAATHTFSVPLSALMTLGHPMTFMHGARFSLIRTVNY